MDVKGTEEAFIKFYKPSDQEFPIGAIGGNDTVGFSFTAPSSMYMVAGQDINIGATSNLNLGGEYTLIGATSTIILTSPEINIPNNLNVSSIRTNQVSSFNVETQYLNVNLIKFDNLINQYVNNISGVDYINIDAPLRTYNFNYISNTGGNNPGVVFQYSDLLDGSLIFNSNNRFVLSKPLDVNQITTDSIIVNNYAGNSISSLRISTGSLFSGFLSSIHTQTSTLSATNTITASTIAIDRIVGNASATNVFTNNLFPISAGAQIGFGPTTASGGYYNQGYFRSTFTSVIQPNTVAGQLSNVVRVNGILSTNTLTTQFLLGAGPVAGTSIYTNTLLPNGSSGLGNTGNNFFTQGCFASTFTSVIQPRTDAGVSVANSNVVRINGFVSTQNVFVSTINRKLYPYTSTLNTPPSTFSYAASNTRSSTVPYVLYSNVAFPNAGWFSLSQKAIFTRASGGSDTHQSILYTPGAFISTPSQKDGYATLPYLNENNSSTFTTLTTQLYISSTQLNRNIILYNGTNNNFVGNLFLDSLNITYTPSQGINPE
jgi:hypothetical protein